MRFITDRLYAFVLGIMIAIVGLVNPNLCRRGILAMTKTLSKENG